MEKPEKIHKLDIIDKKILAVLLKSGRIGMKELAEVINNHYPTVINRVNKLIEIGVINKFYPVLQLPGIGIRKWMSLYLILKPMPDEKKNEFVKEFKKNPFLIQIMELEGQYSFTMLLVCNYIKEAYETINYIKQVCGDYLSDLNTKTTFTISNLNRQFFLDEEINLDKKEITTGFQPIINKTKLVHLGTHVKLNDKDIKLLNYLKLNARDTVEEIEEKTRIKRHVINYKIEKYLNDNLITYFTIDINHSKLGYYQYILFLNMKGDVKKKKILIDELYTKTKEAYHLFEYLDFWEVVVTYCVKDQKRMNEIIDDIKNRYGPDIQHQLLYIKKKHKVEPYPDVELVYPKD